MMIIPKEALAPRRTAVSAVAAAAAATARAAAIEEIQRYQSTEEEPFPKHLGQLSLFTIITVRIHVEWDGKAALIGLNLIEFNNSAEAFDVLPLVVSLCDRQDVLRVEVRHVSLFANVLDRIDEQNLALLCDRFA